MIISLIFHFQAYQLYHHPPQVWKEVAHHVEEVESFNIFNQPTSLPSGLVVEEISSSFFSVLSFIHDLQSCRSLSPSLTRSAVDFSCSSASQAMSSSLKKRNHTTIAVWQMLQNTGNFAHKRYKYTHINRQ